MKNSVYDMMHAYKPNIKKTIMEFYKLKCWKDVNHMYPTPENK